jgi:diguanylate cyclase (GGDEF)-like protein
MTEGSDAGAPALAEDLRSLLRSIAAALVTPLALLSREGDDWRFEGEAFPPAYEENGHEGLASVLRQRAVSGEPLWEGMAGFVLGRIRGREWVLLIPGPPERWRENQSVDGVVKDTFRVLRRLLNGDHSSQATQLGRRLYAFSRRLERETDTPRVHALILETIARHVKARIGALVLYQADDNSLAIVATHGYPAVLVEHLRIQPGEGILGRAFADGRADVHEVEGARRLRYRTTSYLTVPFMGQHGPTGVLALTDRADGQPFDQRDLTDARILAGSASLALAREDVQKNLRDLQRAAAIDSVTGLFNRRHFETRLKGEVQRATRQQQPLSVLMVDIDDFKRINDTFGHIEGDRALRTVAELLRGGVRIFDVCARYGGEEFAILMPGASLDTAAQVAERIRRRVHQRFRDDRVGVTVSIGVARLSPGHSGEELVGEADRRLGLAKRAGKNAVEAVG